MTFMVNVLATLGYDFLSLLALLLIIAVLTAAGHILCATIHGASGIGSYDTCTGVGRLSGFCFGLVWSIAGFCTSGVLLTLVSVVGLCVIIAVVAHGFWQFCE